MRLHSIGIYDLALQLIETSLIVVSHDAYNDLI